METSSRKPENKFNGPYCATDEMMRYIAKMANMEYAGITRMILVLDVEDFPRLYTSSFLDDKKVNITTPRSSHKDEFMPKVNDDVTLTTEGIPLSGAWTTHIISNTCHSKSNERD